MKNKNVFLLMLFLASLTLIVSCNKDDDNDSANSYVNNWILENMQTYYLWNDKIPTNGDKESTPSDYFRSLLYRYKKVDGDRFSWIQNNYLELLNSLSGVEKEAGYYFTLFRLNKSSDKVIGFINYVKPNSPAASAGMKRGDLFLKISGTQITTSNYLQLVGKMSENHTLTLAQLVDGVAEPDNEISLSVVEYHENPVFLDSIYNINGKKIAYLVYNFFAADDGDGSMKYDKQLNQVFAKFKAENVSDMILDLRHNSGGSVNSSIYLASMIVRNFSTNSIFAKREYNEMVQKAVVEEKGADFLVDKFKNAITRTNSKGSVVETIPLNNIGVNSLYILTSDNTASASEMVINGLKPYMPVTIIGDTTVGKNVGSVSIYEKNDPKNKWGMQPIVLRITNCEDKADYAAGFAPDLYADEYDLFNTRQLGDVHEIFLGNALQMINGETFVQSKTISSYLPKYIMGSSISCNPQRQNMYIEANSLPFIQK